MSSRPVGHPDRIGLAGWHLAGIVASTAVALAVAGRAAAMGQLTPEFGAFAGAAVGVLAVLGLPSLSIRLVARVLTGVSAAVLVRYGVMGGAVTGGGQPLLLWLVAAVAVLVLTDRVGVDAAPPLGGDGAPAARTRPLASARTVAVVSVLVLAAAALLAPLVLPRVGEPAEPGEGATLDPTEGPTSALRSTDSLDMTQRPELTDEVVFTVESDAATFWRGQTFDVWDGRRWTRSDQRFTPLAASDRLAIAADDLGARGPDVVEQRIRIEAPFADVVYAAPSPVALEVDRPVRQRDDGTLVSAPMGRGTTYTVVSRREPLSAERLRAVDAGATPPEVTARWGAEPVATERVRELAAELGAGATTRFDTIEAITAWMGERIEYSIDAPLSPPDRDVVDHFLFDAEQGWCEQIASSLVVLARLNGIPARLATGFVPAERDPITGVFTVRERDAHAWAEVWFPEVGWVPFDPTADVPLAGEDQADATVGAWLADHALVLLLGLGALGLLAGPVRAALVRRWRARPGRPASWAAAADRRLVALGVAVERVRAPAETATAFGRALAERYGDPRLAEVGRIIDDALYAAVPLRPADQAMAEEVLAAHEGTPAPAPEPLGAP